MRLNNSENKHWEYIKPGWHEFYISNNDPIHLVSDKIQDIYEWIYKHVDNCEVHARWILTNEGLYLKFRYERDYIRFVLVWG